MKTLIVEDDMMSQCVLAKVLTERGHEVVSYENAEQAILAYQKQFYPLVFVDVGLPGMDGLQFCKWVRAQPNGGKVFMMVATSPGQPGDMGEVLAVGANDFLPKPYEVGALKVRLSIAEKQMKEFFERKDGTECVTFLSAAPVRTESGEFRGSLWMVADLTGRKNLEAELIDTRRKSEGQVRDLTAELNQTRKSLQAESAERKKVEQTLQ